MVSRPTRHYCPACALTYERDATGTLLEVDDT
jgi:hypothetical protein